MNCLFCNIDNNSILYKTKNFYVKVGKGIITAGHIMIIPKKHYKAIAEIENNLVNEYLELKDKVAAEVTKQFAKPFLVEYGVYGQSVFHAHIHIIPTFSDEYNSVNILRDIFLPASKELNVKLIKITSFKELQNHYEKHKMYIYFESDGEQYIFPVNNNMQSDISLLNYRCFFNNLGLKGVKSWQNMTEEDIKNDNIKIEKTKQMLIHLS